MYSYEDEESYYGENISKHNRRHENLMPRNYHHMNGNSSKYHMYEHPYFSDSAPVHNGFSIVQNRYPVNGRNEAFYREPNANYFSQEFYRNDHTRRKHRNERSSKERYEYRDKRYETPAHNRHRNMPPKDRRFRQRRFSDSTYDRHNRRDLRRNDDIFDNYEQSTPLQRQLIFQTTGNYSTEEIQPFDKYEQPNNRKVHYDINPNNRVDYNDNNIGKTDLPQPKTRNKSKLCIIVFKIIFLCGGIATGIASCIKAPWWTKTENTQLLSVGLWETCTNFPPATSWECRTYSNTTNEIRYKDIKVLQYCMIAGISSSGAALLVIVVVGFGLTKYPRVVRFLIYICGIFTLGAAIVFGLTIAYASDNRDPSTLIPAWITPLTGNLDHAIMFYVACAAAACLFMALIHVAVLLFINDDYDTDLYESNKRDKKKKTQHLNDSRIQNEYKNPAFQEENAINQQTDLYRLETSIHSPNKHKQNKRVIVQPNEPSGVNPNYLGPNGQIYNHPMKNNIGYNENFVADFPNSRNNVRINDGPITKVNPLPHMLKQNYTGDYLSKVHLTNGGPVPTFFNSANSDTDLLNSTRYKENRPSIPSVDYETYFNNPY